MPASKDHDPAATTEQLRERLAQLNERIDHQQRLETQLNETLHSLRVHQEELRVQNEDLITAQREITQSQRKYRDLFDLAPVGYFLINPDGVVVQVNLTGANMIGHHRSAIEGKPLFLFAAPASRSTLERHLRELWRGRPASAEVSLVRTDATTMPVELFSVPVADEGRKITQCRIAAIDISRRRQAEVSLRESERRLDAIVKTIPDIVYRLDRNGMINFISESIRRYGYSPGELLGQPILNLVHPQDRPGVRHRISERRTGERSTNALEVRFMARNVSPAPGTEAQERFFLLSAEGLYDGKPQGGNDFIGTQGIAHDITQRRQTEHDRHQLEAELHKARKLEAVGTLAGGIAHDFNNLLMGIQGSVSLMELDHDEGEAEACRQRIAYIEECVRRGSELTQQLLGFAKRGKYNVAMVNINRIVAETVSLFARTHKAIDIRQALDPALWTVEADRGQLERVLLNLLINADQAMPDGGRISLETRNITLDALPHNQLGLRPGRFVRIGVSDTGIGMDAATRERIFEPFFTTKQMGRGTGLGLASAYGIIDNHGGAIDVASTPGKGSSFHVYLPAAAGREAPGPERTEGIVAGSGTILLVDDEKIVIDVTGRLLERLGYRVITAADGEAAESIYRERHASIDLVVLDMIMPQMSGFETYQRLKQINPHIRVLLSSGYSRKGQAEEIVVRDHQDFMQKPFDMARLSQKIARMLVRQRDREMNGPQGNP